MKSLLRLLTGPTCRNRCVRISNQAAWVEPLEPRRLLSAVLVQPIGSQKFAQNTSGTPEPISADLYNFFADTATNQTDLAFTASSDNKAVVDTSVSGSVLSLVLAPNTSGFAHVQVVATDPSGAHATNTFRVQVTAATDRSLDVPLGASRHSFRITQSNGPSELITLSGPGSATIHMGGDGLALAGDHARGSNQEMESITLTGTTAATTLTITGRPAKRVDPAVGDITSDGGMRMIRVRAAALDGDVTITGSVGQFTTDLALAGVISIGTGTRPMVLQGGTLQDESFVSGTPVRSMLVSQWLNSDDVPETFAAPYVQRLTSFGNFTPGLLLSGAGAPGHTLDHALIRGSVANTWNVKGASGPLRIGGAGLDFHATFGSIPSIVDTGLFDGTITATSLQKFIVSGPMVDAGLTFTATGTTDLGQLKAGGGIFGVTITAAGSIGDIIAPTLSGSDFSAGLATLPAGQTLPASAADFASPASIHSITLRPRAKMIGFVGSNLAASSIGKLSLGTIQSSNSGKAFGIATTSLGSLFARDVSRPQTFRFTGVHDPNALAAQMTAEKLNPGDFVIRLL